MNEPIFTQTPIFDELTFERLVAQLATVDSLADLGWEGVR